MLKTVSFIFFLTCLVTGPLAGFGLSLMLIRTAFRRSLKWPAIAMALLAGWFGGAVMRRV